MAQQIVLASKGLLRLNMICFKTQWVSAKCKKLGTFLTTAAHRELQRSLTEPQGKL